MPSAKLTARTVAAAKKAPRGFVIYDTELPGFGLRVMPSGFKSWVVEYRPRGGGRATAKKRITIGSAAVLTATKARAIAKDTLADIRQGNDPLAKRRQERDAMTISELAERFLTEHVQKRRKPATATMYRRALEIHVIPRLGSKKAATVTRSDLSGLHADLTALPTAGSDRSRRSSPMTKRGGPIIANRSLAAVGSMFAWAGRQGFVPEGFNPTAGIERNPEQGRERYLSTDELERLGRALRDAETVGLAWDTEPAGPRAKHLPKPENRRTVLSPHAVAAIRLLILTGCRLREILHLRWAEVDVERGMLHLPTSKTGRKSVVLNAPALAVLENIPHVGELVIAGRSPKLEGDLERPRSDLKKPWAAICRAAALDGVRIHDLRHSFASVGAGAGLGLPIVGKLLGHTQATTTQKYAHLDSDPLRRATNAIGATIAAAMAGRT